MQIYETYRPKMDWPGKAWKWYCEPCRRGGVWTSEKEAVASGEAHAKAKHNGAPDWKQ